MTRYAHRDAGDLRWISAGGDFAMRDAAQGDGRTVEGIAVPYGVPTMVGAAREFPGMAEAFDRGAFADVLAQRGDRSVAIIDEHDGHVVGAAQLYDSPEGLRYRGRLLTSQAARDFAERVVAQVVAPSIEFVIGEVRRAGNVVYHTRVRALGGIAATYKPAYTGSSFSVRAMEGHTTMDHCTHCGAELAPAGAVCNCDGAIAARAVPAQTIASVTPTADRSAAPAGGMGYVLPTDESMRRIAIEAAQEVMRRNLEGAGPGHADPLADINAYRSLGELMHAAGQDGADRELTHYAARALADQLTTDSNAGVTVGNTLTDDIKGIVARGRPSITAFGGPRPLPDGPGMSATWPVYSGDITALMGVQATQKTEITSVKVEIGQGTEAIRTFAGGSDIAYQLIARSTPAYLDAYARIMLIAYAYVTNLNFVTELESGSVTGDFTEALATVDATELLGLLVDASVAVEVATGAPASIVLASTTAFKAAAKLFTPTPVSNARGSMSLAQLSVNVGGLNIVHEAALTAGKFVVSNELAAGWYETGPFQATAEDVALLGKNVAYWGMGVPARFIPAGIVEVYDVTP